MASLELELQSLSRGAFAAFGEVIEIGEHNELIHINYGQTERHHKLVTVDAGDGEAIISLFRTQAATLPFRVRVMERHPLGSQAFMPLTPNPYLVLVAPPGDFQVAGLRAFIAQADQGVNYRRGTWHHYCLGLNGSNDFLVVDRSGPGNNCDEVTMPDDLIITVNPVGAWT